MDDSCCPKDSWGAPLATPAGIKSLTGANGELVKIGPHRDLEIYVTRPPSSSSGKNEEVKAHDTGEKKNVLLVFTDVYGLQNRLFAICDKFSQDLECYVVAIDCLRGETKDGHLDDFMDWLRGHPYDRESDNVSEKCHPVREDMEYTLEYLSQTFSIHSSNSNIGLIGFCWGVWAITKACAMLESDEKHGNNGKNNKHNFSSWNVICGVGFHPSLKFEDVAFDKNQVEMAKSAARNVPLLYLVAGNDAENIKPPEGEIAKVISDSVNIHCEGQETNREQLPRCVEFPDMLHGWVSRGDTSLGEVKKGAEDALMMAVEFFRVWM